MLKQASIEDTTTKRDKAELHVFADASEDTMCAVAYLRSHPKECSADFAFVIGKCRVARMRHLSIPRLELQAAVMAVRLKEQIVKEHEMKLNSCIFLVRLSHGTAVDTQFPSQTTSVCGQLSGWDTRYNWCFAVETCDRYQQPSRHWHQSNQLCHLTGPAWLKRPESEWPEQVNLIFASDEENIPSSVFMIQAEEKKAVIQWERFSNFNRLVNSMAYVHRYIEHWTNTNQQHS